MHWLCLRLREMIRDNMVLVWPLAGLASAFHVLVGGWALLVFIFCLVVLRILSPRPAEGQSSHEDSSEASRSNQGSRLQASLAIVTGAIFFLVGALPPLLVDFSADPEISLAASNVYVHSRISHHLLFGSFPTMFVGRFVLMMIGWAMVGIALMRYRPALKLQLFCIGSLLISLAGLLLSGMAEQDGATGDFACRLLRFYWFRLADFALPAAFSLSTTVILGHWFQTRMTTTRYRNIAIFSSFMILVAAGILIVERHTDPRPRADRRSLPRYDNDVDRTVATYNNWKKACEWIRENTPADSVFITPARQQTFKWYAGRTEVACWKDIPQDAAGILEWNQRLDAVYFPQTIYPAGLMSFDDQQLKELATRFNVDYLLLPQYQVDLASPSTDIEQVYPEPGKQATYVVLKVDGYEN